MQSPSDVTEGPTDLPNLDLSDSSRKVVAELAVEGVVQDGLSGKGLHGGQVAALDRNNKKVLGGEHIRVVHLLGQCHAPDVFVAGLGGIRAVLVDEKLGDAHTFVRGVETLQRGGPFVGGAHFASWGFGARSTNYWTPEAPPRTSSRRIRFGRNELGSRSPPRIRLERTFPPRPTSKRPSQPPGLFRCPRRRRFRKTGCVRSRPSWKNTGSRSCKRPTQPTLPRFYSLLSSR